jgi:hypothetical protein
MKAAQLNLKAFLVHLISYPQLSKKLRLYLKQQAFELLLRDAN